MKVGDKFNQWTVLQESIGKQTLCQCSCGAVYNVDTYNLRHNKSRRCLSCAAGMQQLCEGRLALPHLSKELYYSLSTKVSQAIARCTNPQDANWKYYGGRGITVCQEWYDDPVAFIVYLASLDGFDDPNLWLDREDNNGHYEPGNLRFVTPSESGLNRRPRCASAH